jgi:hypothetical protein
MVLRWFLRHRSSDEREHTIQNSVIRAQSRSSRKWITIPQSSEYCTSASSMVLARANRSWKGHSLWCPDTVVVSLETRVGLSNPSTPSAYDELPLLSVTRIVHAFLGKRLTALSDGGPPSCSYNSALSETRRWTHCTSFGSNSRTCTPNQTRVSQAAWRYSTSCVTNCLIGATSSALHPKSRIHACTVAFQSASKCMICNGE